MAAVATAGGALDEGMQALAQGARALADGCASFDADGMDRLAQMGGEDLAQLLFRVRALRAADEAYTNFGGIAPDRTGETRFIIETDAIEAE